MSLVQFRTAERDITLINLEPQVALWKSCIALKFPNSLTTGTRYSRNFTVYDAVDAVGPDARHQINKSRTVALAGAAGDLGETTNKTSERFMF